MFRPMAVTVVSALTRFATARLIRRPPLSAPVALRHRAKAPGRQRAGKERGQNQLVRTLARRVWDDPLEKESEEHRKLILTVSHHAHHRRAWLAEVHRH